MRTPWPNNFPPVFVSAAWNADTRVRGPILPDQPGYWPAKTKRNVRAAAEVCDSVVQEDTLTAIYELCHRADPIIVSPAMSPQESQNALAIGYGAWLENELGWPHRLRIFQKKSVSRDFNTDGWFRLVHNPEFYGEVAAGRNYIIADDVFTMGGTLASVRGFIESQGGRVICCTALASGDGNHVPIALEAETLYRLSGQCGGALNSACLDELGYELECLTEAEGGFLRRCASLDAFRKGVDGARNG